MDSGEPSWLLGLKTSPCAAYRWHDYSERQFFVLPFYPDGDRRQPEQYAMWGRALSDGLFYPIPPSMYRLALTECEPAADNSKWYQWTAETHGHQRYCIPVEMQRIRAVQTGRDYLGDLILALEESPVVTPEFVEEGLASETNIPTNFYPDASLWGGTVTTEHWLPRHHQRCAGLGSTNRLPQSRIIFALVTSRFAF
jgi:hypothetical protein